MPSKAVATASEPRGIVILGTPRSGTTLLRRILDAHPAIACPPETYVLSAAARFLHEERFAAGLRIGVLLGLSYSGFSEAEVLERLRGFVFGFLQDHAARQGKARWAEKTAFDAFHVPAIRRLCAGHVRFVCLQRHGLDVACSIADLVSKTGGYVEELHDYVRRYPEPLEAFTRAWIDTATDIAELAAGEPLALDLRYEDLVREPETVVRRVLDFVGEPWVDGLIERALAEPGRVGFGDWKTYGRGVIDSSSVDRWRALPRPTIDHLAGICDATLERLGYEPAGRAHRDPQIDSKDSSVRARTSTREQPAEPDPDEARRRYELGLLINRMRTQKKGASE